MNERITIFIDKADIIVRGGRGGRGIISFDRKKFLPFGGPDGGDGGNGGKVILRATNRLFDLSSFVHNPLYAAENGYGGQGGKKAGRAGENLIIEVPIGTIVIDKFRNEQIIELLNDRQEIVLARGGKGGRGNVHFKSSTNRAPRYAEWGEIGESRELTLDFTMVIDIAFIGSPNSGKSLLLNVLTGSKAEVAQYPYTTTIPVLGVLKTDPPLTICEIPSLRDSEGNLRFWKQTKRAKVLVLVVDLSVSNLDREIETFFSENIKDKQLLIVGNKKDLLLKTIRRLSKKKGIPMMQVSAVSGEGLKELEEILLKLATKKIIVERKEKEEVTLFSTQAPIVRKISDGVFEIKSYEVELALSSINLDTPKGIQILRKKIKELGLETLLIKAGIEPYQQVKIGETWFTYLPEK